MIFETGCIEGRASRRLADAQILVREGAMPVRARLISGAPDLILRTKSDCEMDISQSREHLNPHFEA